MMMTTMASDPLRRKSLSFSTLPSDTSDEHQMPNRRLPKPGGGFAHSRTEFATHVVVEQDEPMRLADLCRREAYAWRRVHRLGHVIDELLDVGRDLCHGQRLLAQSRVRVVQDGANRHGSLSSMEMISTGLPNQNLT